MKERKQKTLAKRLLVAMLSVMMAVTFIPTSLFAYAAEPEVTPDDVQKDAQTEVVQDEPTDTVQKDEPQTESTKAVKEESTKATEAQKKQEAKEDESEKTATNHFSKELEEVIVDVETEKGAFDEDVSLKVKPIAKDSKAYKKAEKALEENEQVYAGMLAFDIHFENSKGNEIEPDGTVSVKMTAKKEVLKDIAPDAFDADSVQITHIGKKATEVVADTVNKNKIDGTVDVKASKKAVEKIDAEFEVKDFSTFALTWGEDSEHSATIHFVELNEDGTMKDLDPSVSLDTSAATVSLNTDFPDVAGKEYRFVGGYYSETAVTKPADDATNINVTLTKKDDGTWECTPVAPGAEPITIKNGSHIYASYKQFTKAGKTPATGDANKIKPDSIKNVTDNNDGTYTVRLDINGHQFEEKQGANVLLIFDRTSSMVSNNMGNKTRFQAAKDATKVLVNALDPATNPIKISVMSFARLADDNTEVDPDYVAWTRNGTAITDFTDGLTAAPSGSTQGKGGTNWEAAFVKAKTLINALPEADKANPTYVVFLTDGNPTIYVGSNTIRNATSTSAEYTRARTEASGLNSSIPIYGVLCANANDGPLLNTLMNDLKSSDYGSHETHYVLANDETTLTNTFHTIATTIVASLGANQASTNDGVTALSTTSATAGAAGAFKYYKTVRPAGMEDTQIIPHNQLVPWDGAPAAAYSASTGVTWDLESVGVLEDNTSYTLEFTVWPSQAAYDLIADLNNGLKVYEEGHSNSITAAERAQVYESGGKYYLKTNTNFDTSYNFDNTTYTDDGITQTTGNMVLPTETIDIEKIWNNLLDQANPPDKAVLVLTKDGANYLAGDDAIIVSANSDPAKNWKAEVFISLGQILQNNTDKTYQVLETGHDYEIIEPPELNKYQWELHSEIFRPMVINGAVVMLIKDNNASGTDGVDYYTIGGNKYKKDTGSNSLKAWNDRRSWLQLEKKVQDSTPAAPADTLFEYTITINNSNASQGKESDTASDFYVWFSAFDGSSAVKDLEVSSNVHAETDTSGGKTGYFYVKSGEQFTVKIKKGWTFRVLNLPSGSTYNIKETSIPDGFALVEATDRQKVDTEAQQAAPARPTINGATVDGTINVPNVEFYVDYTNKYEETDITIAKVWEVATGQQSVMSPDAFKSCLTLLANGTATTAYNDNLTITDVTPEGQTNKRYSVKYDKLPKYKNGQLVEYKVKESTIPEGYELTGSDTASDGGTITNTAKTGDLKITKKMGEDDDYGQIPDGLKIVVTGPNGFKETLTGTMLKQGNGSYTFEDVALGEYTATEPAETADIDGYLRDTTFSPEGGKVTVSADDTATAEIIVTNTYTSNTTKLKVKKNWIDANNQDGLRPATLIVKILADSVELVEKQVTLSAENNWEAEIEGLAIYGAGGQKIVYTLVEVLDAATAAAYTATSGETVTATEELDESGELKNYKAEFTNKHTPETTSITVDKVWEDAGNQDGVRPETLTYTLTQTVNVAKNGSASYTWEDLDVYKGGNKITYAVTEAKVDGYTTEVGELTAVKDEAGKVTGYKVEVTNTHTPETTSITVHTPETTSITVKKKWTDNENKDKLRPDSIAVQFRADGELVEEVELNEQNKWSKTWENMPVYKEGESGQKIVYTVDEPTVPEYYDETVGELTPVEVDGEVVGYEIEIENTLKEVVPAAKGAVLNIHKVDQDGKDLEGVKFTLANENKTLPTVTTNEYGNATINIPVNADWLPADERAPNKDKYEFTLVEEEKEGFEPAGPWTVTVETKKKAGTDETEVTYTVKEVTDESGEKKNIIERFISWITGSVDGKSVNFVNGVATITNKAAAQDVVVTKTYEGIDALPDTFGIDIEYVDYDAKKGDPPTKVTLKPGMDLPTNITEQATDGKITWTISKVRYGTQFSAKETGYAAPGYAVNASLTSKAGTETHTDTATGEDLSHVIGKVPAAKDSPAATFDFKNTYTHVNVEIDKEIDKLVSFDEDEEVKNITFTFRVVGKNAKNETKLNTVVAVEFNAQTGKTTQPAKIEKIPADITQVTVTEIDSGNYQSEKISESVTEADFTKTFKFKFKNTQNDDDYDNGAINKYEKSAKGYVKAGSSQPAAEGGAGDGGQE